MMLANPFAAFAVTQGWHSAHQAIDFGTPWGTVFGAPSGGTYHHLGGSLGYSATPGTPGLWGELRRADGSRIRFAHLSRHVAGNGTRVAAGDSLAATGNSGYVIPAPTRANPRAGSHMHTYGLDRFGNRWNWITDTAQLAGEEDEDMLPDEREALLAAQRDAARAVQVLERLAAVLPAAGKVPGTEDKKLLATNADTNFVITRLRNQANGTSRLLDDGDGAVLDRKLDELLARGPVVVDVDALAEAITTKLGNVGCASPDQVRTAVDAAFVAAARKVAG